MMMFMFLKSAFAGTIFVTDSLSPAVVQIDTRNYFGSTVAFLPGMMDHVGGYVDMNTGAYVVVGGYPAFAAFSVEGVDLSLSSRATALDGGDRAA